MSNQKPRIGDRVSASHAAGNEFCANATCRTYEGFITDIVQDIITIYDGQHHVRIKNTGAWVLEIYDEVT
ncbi:MAG TPA: hypothetical protein PLJ04_03495 [Candidatus Saccharibacteria bacterium]|nr:hypothetical protein [Candidatus Saccharibacteria bacterium]MCB9817302.1 hypothetical protein [Candidatus Nomurabacteria bacterium]HPD99378.1 hypothetical protein [Candidatus Saccharibacteria bacterium]HPR10619.1 hypothetical protein [Candidatus Saccharibacteria bacterium]